MINYSQIIEDVYLNNIVKVIFITITLQLKNHKNKLVVIFITLNQLLNPSRYAKLLTIKTDLSTIHQFQTTIPNLNYLTHQIQIIQFILGVFKRINPLDTNTKIVICNIKLEFQMQNHLIQMNINVWLIKMEEYTI